MEAFALGHAGSCRRRMAGWQLCRLRPRDAAGDATALWARRAGPGAPRDHAASRSKRRMSHPGVTLSVVADERLALLNRIAELITTARSMDLHETVFLLNMVHLDLQTKIHKIDDGELQAFMTAVRSSVDRR